MGSSDALTCDLERAPFVGPRPYETSEHRLFFGRDAEAAHLSDLWRANRLTVLHGGSGVGKSSLLRAGAMPLLTGRLAHVLPVGDVSHRTAFPVAALPERNPYVFALLSSWFPADAPTMLAGESIGGCLARHARRDRFGGHAPVFAAIDQAERLFRPSSTQERQRREALDQLMEMLAEQPALHLLITIRDDQLDDVLAFSSALAPVENPAWELRPLTENAARRAVEGPLAGAGLQLGSDTVECLIEELCTIRTSRGGPQARTTEVDPSLLQLVCTKLWKRLTIDQGPPRRQLAREIDQALSEFCSQSLAAIAADHRLPPRDVGAWFRTAFAGQRGLAAVDEPPERGSRLPLSVLRAVEDHHLIRVRQYAGSRWYELHPRLVSLLDRLDEDPGPARRPDAPARLRAAQTALADGDHGLARHHVQAAIRACRADQMRILADAESFLGNIAYEQADLQLAELHYRKAAEMYEAIHDTRAVGRLLAAQGRLKLMAGLESTCSEPGGADPSARSDAETGAKTENDAEVRRESARRSILSAVADLRAAGERVPNDAVVQTLLAQALWHAGHPKAALAVLNSVIDQDGDRREALHLREEFLAGLGSAPTLPDNPGHTDLRT